MTNTKKTLKGLLAFLVSLAMAMTLGVSLFASAAAETATETVVVTQSITENTTPKQTSYTYWLTPEKAECPLPVELKEKAPVDGRYEIGTIEGNSTDETALKMTFEIDKTQSGSYAYYLEKSPETPSGDTFTLEKWKFGFRVTPDADGKTGNYVAFPEVCVGGDSQLSDNDEFGYPTKLTLKNVITGKENTTKSTTTTTKKGVTTRKVTTARGGTTARAGTTSGGTSSRARWVNTGDESQFFLWVAVIGVAALGLILIIFLRHKRDDEDEDF